MFNVGGPGDGTEMMMLLSKSVAVKSRWPLTTRHRKFSSTGKVPRFDTTRQSRSSADLSSLVLITVIAKAPLWMHVHPSRCSRGCSCGLMSGFVEFGNGLWEGKLGNTKLRGLGRRYCL